MTSSNWSTSTPLLTDRDEPFTHVGTTVVSAQEEDDWVHQLLGDVPGEPVQLYEPERPALQMQPFQMQQSDPLQAMRELQERSASTLTNLVKAKEESAVITQRLMQGYTALMNTSQEHNRRLAGLTRAFHTRFDQVEERMRRMEENLEDSIINRYKQSSERTKGIFRHIFIFYPAWQEANPTLGGRIYQELETKYLLCLQLLRSVISVQATGIRATSANRVTLDVIANALSDVIGKSNFEDANVKFIKENIVLPFENRTYARLLLVNKTEVKRLVDHILANEEIIHKSLKPLINLAPNRSAFFNIKGSSFYTADRETWPSGGETQPEIVPKAAPPPPAEEEVSDSSDSDSDSDSSDSESEEDEEIVVEQEGKSRGGVKRAAPTSPARPPAKKPLLPVRKQPARKAAKKEK